MRMLNHLKVTNKIKKSHLLIIGSLFVFLGIVFLSWNYLLKMKDEVYSMMQISMTEKSSGEEKDEVIEEIPVVDNLTDNSNNTTNNDNTSYKPTVNYDKYYGVLEIPRIGLKRGFYNIDSKYNDIQYNVTIVHGSTMPNVVNGNLILMAHSGDAYISYFAYLYRLNVGDFAYITYKGQRYQYRIVNIYNVEKNGTVKIIRNYDRTTLTLVTCTKDNDSMQTVYIAELI